MMLVYRSRARKISGGMVGISLLTGIFGLGLLLVTGVQNTQLYWNALWVFMGFMASGIIGVRVHSMIWRNK